VPFSQYDAVTTELLYQVYDAAWLKVQTTGAASAQTKSQLVAAADTGERDFDLLKALAFKGI
jgi:hypothetical protein